ncbi:MAG TPA: DUF2059 domain-containing protein [Xanthomonadaceae bacterium]|jgi:hypothetical protein
MRRTLAIALACMAATPLAFAQGAASPAKMQMALKLYDISGANTVFQALESNILGNVMGSIGQSLGDKASCPALQPEAQAFKTKMDTMFSGMNDPAFRQEAGKVFADSFSDDELRQILAFEQSPAGQKLQKMQPELLRRIGALAETRAKVRDGDIRTAAQSLSTNVQRIAATCPSAPAAAPAKK